jgi:hypothetical protein
MKIEQYIIGLETHCENILNQLYKLLSSEALLIQKQYQSFSHLFFIHMLHTI